MFIPSFLPNFLNRPQSTYFFSYSCGAHVLTWSSSSVQHQSLRIQCKVFLTKFKTLKPNTFFLVFVRHKLSYAWSPLSMCFRSWSPNLNLSWTLEFPHPSTILYMSRIITESVEINKHLNNLKYRKKLSTFTYIVITDGCRHFCLFITDVFKDMWFFVKFSFRFALKKLIFLWRS